MVDKGPRAARGPGQPPLKIYDCRREGALTQNTWRKKDQLFLIKGGRGLVRVAQTQAPRYRTSSVLRL